MDIFKMNSSGAPVHRLADGTVSPQDYGAVCDDLEAQLAEAGIPAPRLSCIPSGWLPIFQAAIPEWVRLQKSGSQIEIDDIKEKFGTLSMFVSDYGDGSNGSRAVDIADWCEEQSDSRCMVFGTPGERTHEGWILTLSPEALALRETQDIRHLIYPDRNAKPDVEPPGI